MKITRSHSDDEEKDEEEDYFAAPGTAEAIDWVHEYELIKQSKLANLRRMKSRRLKDMIRRLSFLQEKVRSITCFYLLSRGFYGLSVSVSVSVSDTDSRRTS